MGLILGIVAIAATAVMVFFIILANSMSDAPGVQIPILPAVGIGGVIATIFILTHYHAIPW